MNYNFSINSCETFLHSKFWATLEGGRDEAINMNLNLMSLADGNIYNQNQLNYIFYIKNFRFVYVSMQILNKHTTISRMAPSYIYSDLIWSDAAGFGLSLLHQKRRWVSEMGWLVPSIHGRGLFVDTFTLGPLVPLLSSLFFFCFLFSQE